MNYWEQLNTEEWLKKRQIILLRDNHYCQNCFNREYSNNFKGGIAKFSHTTKNYNIFNLTNHQPDLVFLSKELNYDKVFVYYSTQIENKDYVFAIAIRETDNNDLILSRHNQKLKKIEEVRKYFNNFSPERRDAAKILLSASYKLKQEELDKLIENDFKIPAPPLVDKTKYDNWIKVKNLHIHHKYYQENYRAWEYPNDALITLCWFCHEALHKETEIEIRDKFGNVINSKRTCTRCFGAGYIPHFSHIENGICFKCNGNRFIN